MRLQEGKKLVGGWRGQKEQPHPGCHVGATAGGGPRVDKGCPPTQGQMAT